MRTLPYQKYGQLLSSVKAEFLFENANMEGSLFFADI